MAFRLNVHSLVARVPLGNHLDHLEVEYRKANQLPQQVLAHGDLTRARDAGFAEIEFGGFHRLLFSLGLLGDDVPKRLRLGFVNEEVVQHELHPVCGESEVAESIGKTATGFGVLDLVRHDRIDRHGSGFAS